jgi:hypothetical protein
VLPGATDLRGIQGTPGRRHEAASKSPSKANTAAQLDLKMELYFAHGAEEVWIVYPKPAASALIFRRVMAKR